MARDTPWNRAMNFADSFNRAGQLRRAVLPTGKIVEFHAPIIGDRAAEPECADIILRQTVAVHDNRDPRGLGY